MSIQIEDEKIEDQWPYILSLLPEDYEETAKLSGALVRKREVKNASDLLRLVMDYAVRGHSLRITSAWADISGVASMSDVAVLKRLRHCDEWLSILVTQKLEERLHLPELGKLRIRIVDATSIRRKGVQSSDWRLHLGFDLGRLCIDDVWLTTHKVGETLRNFEFQTGDVVIGDRGYGERKGIEHVVKSGADILVRINWKNVPLLDRDGNPFDIIKHACILSSACCGEWQVMTAPTQECCSVSGRLVVLRLGPEAAEKARRRIRKDCRRKGRTPDESTLIAAEFIFVFTTLGVDQASAQGVLEIYRFRWQIELAIKRLKSILHIEQMNALSDDLCRTFLLAKLLAALLIEDLAGRAGAFSPWGYGRPASFITD